MEETSSSFSNYNMLKNGIVTMSKSECKTETNADSDENIIENLISQLTHSDPVTSSGVSNSNSLKLQDPPNLDEILETDETSITPTFHNVSVLNAACQQLLKQMEHQLLSLLKKNRKEQDIIQAFLNSNCKSLSNENSKKSFLKCVGMPYFKDSHGFFPPPNEDVLKKTNNNKLLPIDFIKSFPVWNSCDAEKLIKAVQNTDTSKSSSIDWMKISVTDLEGKYSPSECKSKWNMHLNQSINKSKWSKKEMDSLKALSAKYNYQDWDKIAAELGTNRTGLQCCIQYQVHTFPTEGKWTKEEDENLKKLVEKYRVKDYIPWTKVVWHFENRSLKQCQERYAYHLGNIKKGSFSMEEDFVIVYLASKLKNFGEVAKFLPKRVSPQIRSRYEYLVEVSMPKFTKEEDELLTKLMAKYPRNWAKISEHFKNRSRVQCRKRWGYLEKTIQLEDEIQSGDEDNENEDSASESQPTPVISSLINAESLKKNVNYLSRPSQSVRKYSEVYDKLLDYHKYCHKFLFGPKPRISPHSKDRQKLTSKMITTMKKLSVSNTAPLVGFDISCLSNNCEFDREDLAVLSELKSSEQETKEFELSKEFIPPNYMTLIGLRTFTLAWNKIQSLCHFNKESSQSSLSSTDVSADDRILFSDAKKLFKSRLKTIFAFPMILSNISPADRTTPMYKPKATKAVKPLSKRKRKKHAKLMSDAYRNKIRGEVLGGQSEPVELTESLSTNGKPADGEIRNGCKRSQRDAPECEEVEPPKKRRGRKPR